MVDDPVLVVEDGLHHIRPYQSSTCEAITHGFPADAEPWRHFGDGRLALLGGVVDGATQAW